MANPPVKMVQRFETPDGEEHETYEAAMQHYQKVVCAEAVKEWIEGNVRELVACHVGDRTISGGDDLCDEILGLVAKAIDDGWEGLHGVLSMRVEMAGNTGLVSDTMYPVLNRTLTTVGLPERVLVPLQDSGRHVVGHVVRASAKELLGLPKFGAASFRKVEAMLGKFGLKVGMDTGEWTPPAGYENGD